MYKERYCFHCLHWDCREGETGEGCPIMDAHFLYSYKLANAETPGKHILDILIPPDGVFNAECSMFTPKPMLELKVRPLHRSTRNNP